MKDERKYMDKAVDEPVRYEVSIGFITGPDATLFKDLVEKNEKSLAGGGEGVLVEFFFEGGEDLFDNE